MKPSFMIFPCPKNLSKKVAKKAKYIALAAANNTTGDHQTTLNP